MTRLMQAAGRTSITALFWLAAAMVCNANADTLGDVQQLYRSGQVAAALERADAALAATPKEPQLRFLKGVMLAESRREAEAADVFRQLTEDYPDLAEPYNNLAALYAGSGDFDRARTTLQEALRTNPNYVTALRNLGDVYAMLASRSYAQALKLDARQSQALLPKLALIRELLKPPPTDAAAATAPN